MVTREALRAEMEAEYQKALRQSSVWFALEQLQWVIVTFGPTGWNATGPLVTDDYDGLIDYAMEPLSTWPDLTIKVLALAQAA